jgi:RNA polymerase sigma-70 factor (ECF subfamily)
MEGTMHATQAEDGPLLARAASGDGCAWGALLARHEERLRRVAAFRLDPRLRGRVDESDVVQETFAAATARRAEYFEQRAGPDAQPLFLWLRWMVGNALLDLHRHHMGARMRDARREVPAGRGSGDAGDSGGCDGTRAALVAQLTAGATGPATAAGRAEVKARLYEALGQMDATDREVLALRHFEQLTSTEAAAVLGIQERAAAKRYLRALERLREVLADMPGGLTEIRP